MKLGLGTVQFGLDYGVSNNDGQVDKRTVSDILTGAYHAGIRVIDTASLYGSSEEVIGQAIKPSDDFKIVTKTPFFAHDVITQADAELLKKTFHNSLQKLGRQSVYGLLLHNTHDMYKKGFEYIWQEMEQLQREGLVKKIGMSVYTAQQIDYILHYYPIGLIQLPINVFDQRLLQNNYLEKLKKNTIEIHARSVFLQGLLLMQPQQVPHRLHQVTSHLEKYHEQTSSWGLSPLEASLMFVLAQQEIDYVLVGVCSVDQLKQIIEATQKTHAHATNFETFALHDEKIINPAAWKL